MNTAKSNDDIVMCALVHQVSKAVPPAGTEQDVTTVITRPMWQAFCRAVGVPEDSKPTAWKGVKDTLRVYGSRTIVVDSPAMAAFSFVGDWTG